MGNQYEVFKDDHIKIRLFEMSCKFSLSVGVGEVADRGVCGKIAETEQLDENDVIEIATRLLGPLYYFSESPAEIIKTLVARLDACGYMDTLPAKADFVVKKQKQIEKHIFKGWWKVRTGFSLPGDKMWHDGGEAWLDVIGKDIGRPAESFFTLIRNGDQYKKEREEAKKHIPFMYCCVEEGVVKEGDKIRWLAKDTKVGNWETADPSLYGQNVLEFFCVIRMATTITINPNG